MYKYMIQINQHRYTNTTYYKATEYNYIYDDLHYLGIVIHFSDFR